MASSKDRSSTLTPTRMMLLSTRETGIHDKVSPAAGLCESILFFSSGCDIWKYWSKLKFDPAVEL